MPWKGQRGLLSSVAAIATGAGAAWTPASFGADLVAWYDAQDGSSIAQSGGTVSQWSDKSGNGYHLLQASGTAQPTYDATGMAGKPCLSFNGSDNIMTALGVNLGGGTAAAAFGVLTLDSDAQSYAIMFDFQDNDSGSDTDGPSACFFVREATNAKIGGFRNDVLKSNATVSYSTPLRLGSVYDGTNHTFYLNGVGQTPVSSTGNFGDVGRVNIGDRLSGGLHLKGNVSEMFLIKVAPNSTERGLIDSYLSGRW